MGKKKGGQLGKSLIRDRFDTKQEKNEFGFLHTTMLDDGNEFDRGLTSVTDSNDLEAFFETAQLTGREFTGEKLNVKLITADYRADSEKKKKMEEAALEFASFLRIPRRPKWDKGMTAEYLEQMERDSFMHWRKQIAVLQKNDNLLLTPFERNLEVWKQLWRVIERSQLIVQIVDARNPLLFRCADLAEYVKEIDPSKKNLLLINKSDMLTNKQRDYWGDYFKEQGVDCAFWSAALSAEEAVEEELQRALEEDVDDLKKQKEEDEEEEMRINKMAKKKRNQKRNKHRHHDDDILGDEDLELEMELELEAQNNKNNQQNNQNSNSNNKNNNNNDDEDEKPYAITIKPVEEVESRYEMLSCEQLYALLRELCPEQKIFDKNGKQRPKTVGMVGYPNVGKSSTVNALLKESLVSVSATPGKTKHFQTHNLDTDYCLCDCPGLVFPNFMSTKAEMVVNGILPIDQLREPIGPATLVAQRIHRDVLEETYGMFVVKPHEDEDANRAPTGYELLHAFGNARGFMTAHGLPNVQQSARVILKDFVKGKLLYCHPPPAVDRNLFNPHLKDVVLELTANVMITEANNAKLFATSGATAQNLYKYEDFDDKVDETPMAGVSATRGSMPVALADMEKDEQGRPVGKPWKKHNNKNKREKQRRNYDNKK